ncbi:spermidine synthase [Actinotalea sp. K2]|uniref:spermidine synthase n=1 Tax=Actinotalea sp. K2 TaxID=2939438 RepID=UPI00201757A8|nr:spermidine synthase [Actinotalea sp. K2]MCL3862252.1 spermidine synthase [Actinotalea sp. K2]
MHPRRDRSSSSRRRLEELDRRATPIGEVSLRRRWDPMFGREVHEVKLDDDFLMSSLFTVAEVEVAALALEMLPQDPGTLDVVVGGLGLGFTALRVLESPAVASLVVVDALEAVIDWHRDGLVPAGVVLTGDARCRLVHGDFFAMAGGAGLDPDHPARRVHAIVVDIDHSPRHLLDPASAGFYELAGMRALAAHLHPGGVFSLWSNDPPDGEYQSALEQVFVDVRAEVVRFDNPLQGRESTNTVYLARAAPGT